LREKGLVVALSDKVTGLVSPNHYADIKLKHPERKFKEGANVKCKVRLLVRSVSKYGQVEH
jgi:rRNA biogenesis protein RRP5